MGKQREGDGIKGLPLPDPVDPNVYTEFHICIPNAWQYRSALVGAISELCKYWNWEHTEDDRDAAEQAAFLFKSALTDSGYEEACMTFCERLIACLTSDSDVQDALASLIASNPAVQNAMRDFLQNDQSMREWSQQEARYAVQPGEALATNFGDVPECNPDNLFAVSTLAVDILNEVTEDIFEIVALGLTAAEKGEKLVSAIPLIGGLLPFDEIIGLAADIAGGFQTSYLSAYNETIEDELRCGLFCIAKPTCQLTIADMISYYEVQLGHSLPGGIIESAADIANFLVTGAFPGESIVYGMHLMVLAMIRGAQNVAGINFADMALRLVAAADETNNDWIVLCEDCAPVIEWRPTLINPFQPPDTNVGTFVDDGDGTVVFTAGFSYGAYRVQYRLWNEDLNSLQCFRINSLSYGPLEFPNNIQCDDIVRDGPPLVDEEYGGIVGADLNPFTITVNYSLT